jgi:(p)ppGpp synthase/HD superfamily hydrolase
MQYLSPKLLEAFEFGALAHQAQFRKNPGHVPYFSHPAAVAHILSQAGYSDEVIIAGLLHDVIEDTKYKSEDIEQRFGKRVADLVKGVTEDKRLSWEDRGNAYIQHLHKVDNDVLAISAADLLANRQSLLLEFKKGNNPWNYFTSGSPKEYARKRLEFDRERLAIIKERLAQDFVKELEALEQEVVKLTSKLIW